MGTCLCRAKSCSDVLSAAIYISIEIFANAAPGRLNHLDIKKILISASCHVTRILTAGSRLGAHERVGRCEASIGCNLSTPRLYYHRSRDDEDGLIGQAFIIQLLCVSLHNEVSIYQIRSHEAVPFLK